ncbi:helix-turn-helix domain-containing protein [Vibrio parahaemolyticus]|uniref:helix-turn-helix domain-containing protein n=1 Tax=Vibrio parahaemolyticus TaxID=670 RepID=UPI00396CB31B
MLHTSNPIIKHNAGLLNLAEELGNVSKACKVMGVSRDTFYRYQELVETGGIDALIHLLKKVALCEPPKRGPRPEPRCGTAVSLHSPTLNLWHHL